MSHAAAAPAGAQGAAAGGVKEYTLKAAPSAVAQQMFHVARFSQPNFDFSKLSQPTRTRRSLATAPLTRSVAVR